MKTFKIELKSFYGIDCTGCSHNSEKNNVILVENHLSDILSDQIENHGGSLTTSQVQNLIDTGLEELRPLHDSLWKSVIDMDIEYWLKQGDADEAGVLVNQMQADIESGEFCVSKTKEAFDLENGYNPESEDYDEDDALTEYHEYLKEQEYIPWLNTLSPEQHAQKNGLDIDAVIDGCEGKYLICFNSNDSNLK